MQTEQREGFIFFGERGTPKKIDGGTPLQAKKAVRFFAGGLGVSPQQAAKW